MNNKILNNLNRHISITDFLLLIWKNKFIVFPIIILASAIGYLYDINFINKSNNETLNKINNPKKIETNIRITLPTFNSFFDRVLLKQQNLLDYPNNNVRLEEIRNIEKLKFTKIFESKFLSQNFFFDFLEKNNHQEFKNAILENLKNKYQIYEKNIGFKLVNNENENENKYSSNIPYLIAYLKHNENVDGQKILHDYTKLTYNEVYQIYYNEKIDQLNLLKNIYLEALETASQIDLQFPLILKENSKSSYCEYLYCLGSKILYLKLKKLNEIIDDLNDNFRLLEIEIDIPYTFDIKENSIVEPKKLVPNYIKGFLSGIMISFIVLFLLENIFRKKNARYKV